jgi:hypothetical protein
MKASLESWLVCSQYIISRLNLEYRKKPCSINWQFLKKSKPPRPSGEGRLVCYVTLIFGSIGSRMPDQIRHDVMRGDAVEGKSARLPLILSLSFAAACY